MLKTRPIVATVLLALFIPGAQAQAGDSDLTQAVKLYNQRQYRAALPYLSRAIEKPNSGATPLYYAGLCYQQTGDMRMAKWAYELIEKNYPDSPELRLAKPVLERMKGVQSAATDQARTSDRREVAAARNSAAVPKNAADIMSYLRNYTLSDAEWKSMPDEVKVPFKRATSSHLYVNGSVNGRSTAMMFDTGAEQCHFSRKFLESLGVHAEDTGSKIPVQGVGGSMDTSIMLADVGVGDLRRRIPILVSEGSDMMPIVGETFFKDFRYDIDNSGGFIKFAKKPRNGMTTRSYESTDVIPIPYKDMGNNMVVTCKVNGREFPMIFDTGSFAICFSMVHAASLGISIPSDARQMASSGAGGVVPAYEFRIDRIELGPLIKTNVPVVVNLSSTPVLPLLGQPFYKDRHFTVDPEKHLIKFAH